MLKHACICTYTVLMIRVEIRPDISFPIVNTLTPPLIMYSKYRIMGKFRGRNFRRKAGELNFGGFIFVHMPTTKIFYRTH